MGEDAGLGRDLELLDHLIQHLVEAAQDAQIVTGRVDAHYRIAGAVEQTI